MLLQDVHSWLPRLPRDQRNLPSVQAPAARPARAASDPAQVEEFGVHTGGGSWVAAEGRTDTTGHRGMADRIQHGSAAHLIGQPDTRGVCRKMFIGKPNFAIVSRGL